ncbi:MAG TPA: transglycosylase SLT domain-containing protein [Atribacteraceae bacterium]|nr:transglycosylase SLT domain-containing protein [Atribacteraceae bacterium]
MKVLHLILITCCLIVLSIGNPGFAEEKPPLLSHLLNPLWTGDHGRVLAVLAASPEYALHYPEEVAVLTVVSLLKKDRFTEAVAAVDRFLTDERTLLGDHLLVFLLEDRLERKKFAEAQLYYDRLLTGFPQSPLRFHASLKIVKAMQKIDDLSSAQQFLDQALEFANDSEDRLSAKHLRYDIFLRQQRYPEAALLLRSIYIDYDAQTFTQTRRMASALLGHLSPNDFSPDERLQLGQFFSQLRYWETALSLTEALDPLFFPEAHRRDLGLLLIQIAVNTNDLDQVEEILFRFPILDNTADALFYRGVVHQRKARYQAAIEHYQALIDRFPDSGYLFNTYRNLAFCHQALGDVTTYQKVMERMIETFPRRADLLWNLFWHYHRRNETNRGRPWLERMIAFPSEQNRALFWLAKTSLDETGRMYIERILESEIIDYYFMRAWQEAPSLGMSPTLPSSFPARSEFQPVLGTGPGSSTWQRYTILHRLGYLTRAEIELRAYQRLNPEQAGTWWALSELSARRGNYRRSILQAMRLSGMLSRPYRNIQERIYPVFYFDLIEPLAESIGIDPFLVLSVLRAESFFQYDAVSIAGAIGLMQIMPSTGAWKAERMARNAGRELTWNDSLLFDPAKNIAIGVSYLGYLVDKYGGRICPAICAYNAGPGRINSWLETLPREFDEFVESIPFAETQNYIKKVLENYFYYSWLYRGTFTLSPCIF